MVYAPFFSFILRSSATYGNQILVNAVYVLGNKKIEVTLVKESENKIECHLQSLIAFFDMINPYIVNSLFLI